MFILDILVVRPFDVPFTYSCDSAQEVGQVVCVNFGGANILGIVLKCRTEEEYKAEENDSCFKIKPISYVLSVFLKLENIKFLEKVTEYNIAKKGMILRQILPASAIKIPKKGARKECFEEIVDDGYNFELHNLNSEQDSVYSSIKNTIKEFVVHLIDGETGSGKTEIYLHLVRDIIENLEGQVLILLPEIFLTKQLIERFTKRIGCKPIEWHSKLTPKRRRENFHKITAGKAKFIIGPRSALFLPYKNLKMIVVDEEHDRSYKQEEGSMYNARDMAVLKAQILGINLILTSATPSLESFHNAKEGRYKYHRLSSRFGDATLPEVKIIDLNQHKLGKGKLLAQPVIEEMRKVIAAKKQTLLFLNTRGYAPMMHCNNCSYREVCDNCNSLLVYHKNRTKLMCHHCGFAKKFEPKCANCDSEEINLFGLGIEKLEAEVKELFPQNNIITLTSDIITNTSEIEKALEKIISGKVDIILGTQMISKGLHFPNLRMVGVVDAESNVIGYDPRALEHTYQLLHQVAGRAGREDNKGIFALQTYEPDNPVFKCMQDFDKESFYEYEYIARKATKTAPFYRIFSITALDKEESECISFLDAMKQMLPEDEKSIIILGPAPTPMYYLKGLYRYRIVIKVSKNLNFQKHLKRAKEELEKSFKAKCVVDVDPYNFL